MRLLRPSAESPSERRKRPAFTLEDSTSSDEAAVFYPAPDLKKQRNIAACSHSVGEESQGEGQEDEIHSDKQCSIGEQTENNCCKGCQKRDGMLKTLILQNHLTRVLLTKVLAEMRALKEITQINNAGGSRSVSFLNKFPNLKFPLKSLEEVRIG
ncbi:uncharacterized protein LOC143363475 [Halictus rubicundus]|uniref:uncharacterized protein LOC143363475 n=1 Tax=Halictus rubicundus TaxID=77578 RepID=UPI004035DCE8